ncbi:MAG: carboxypeptidase regulatory-like domain-containing protein [Chitinispirillaceae bacterium]|nr:carboxypeptidase regulatory-like domain-containing protein [Chitinispirillaceae bacterium]
MTKRFIITGIFTFLLSAAPQALTVSGIVGDYLTGNPIESCLVVLNGYSPGVGIDSMRTDGNGRYSFADLSAGVYSMEVVDDRHARDTAFRTFTTDESIPFILYDKKHLLDSLPDTLYKENSPYIVRDYLYKTDEKTLVISPGVTLYFVENGSLSSRYGIFAEGTEQEPIIFTSNEAEMESDRFNGSISGGRGRYRFKYCIFDRISDIFFHEIIEVDVAYCLFSKMHDALRINGYGSGNVVLEHNTFSDCINGVVDPIAGIEAELYDIMMYSVAMHDNIFNCREVALCLSVYGPMRVEHNTILGVTKINMQEISGKDTLINNIFANVRFEKNSTVPFYFAFNAVDSCYGSLPLGVGTNSMTNVRGDSCDFFFNIFTDPLIADSATGEFAQNSPCIGAGSDGTNMGAYKGEDAGARLKGAGHKIRAYRTIRINSGNKVLFVQCDVSPDAVYTVSLYSMSGRQLWTNVKMRPAAGNLHPMDGFSTPWIAPGLYALSISRNGSTAHFVPILVR